MTGNPWLIFCGFFCIYPLIFFGVPAYFIGRFWGRIKLQAPVSIQKVGVKSTAQPVRQRDTAGFGGGPRS
jgi:hypothetical protein